MKHTWILDEIGNVDIFAYERGEYHNGPRCSVCDFGFCHHCNPGGYNDECAEEKAG